MEDYQKSGLASIAFSAHSNEEESGPLALPVGRSPLLVIKLISQTRKDRKNPVKSFLVYPRGVKMVREFKRNEDQNPGGGERGEITGFSQNSKSRLQWIASNAFPTLKSQMALTYHKATPDGRTSKEHLNQFLTEMRRAVPGFEYLWILEFQGRGIPHFHLFLTLPYDTPGLHKIMAHKWHRIADPDSREHLRWHAYKGEPGWETDRNKKKPNFIPWDMGSGSYLCKYLDKEHQKQVPQEFKSVGRFWGCSRGLLATPDQVDAEDLDAAYSWETIDPVTGEVESFSASEYVTRQMGKHHEKSLSGSPWKSSARTRPTSYTLRNGAGVFNTLTSWIDRQPRPPQPVTLDEIADALEYVPF